MWELDYKESWVPKNWCFWTAVLDKTLESPLDCKEIQPVHPKGNQSWMFIGGTDVEAETPILSWLIGKDPDAGNDWGQEEKMAGWHHQHNGHGFGWTLGVGWTGRPGVLWFMGSQGVGHNWVTDLNWTEGSPGVLQSMGSQRVEHDWVTELTDCLDKVLCNTLDIWYDFPLLPPKDATVAESFHTVKKGIQYSFFWIQHLNWHWYSGPETLWWPSVKVGPTEIRSVESGPRVHHIGSVDPSIYYVVIFLVPLGTSSKWM